MSRTRLILGLAFLLLIAGLAFYGLEEGYIRLNYPSKTAFPIRGVDVSHHQGVVDWDLLKTNGVAFAFIKATEGGDFKDPRFLENWEKTKAAGIKRGAYHFFTFCKTGEEQAKNFLDVVPKDLEALPPTLDLEYGGNCGKRPTVKELATEIKTFVTLIKERNDQTPIFYVTPEFVANYLTNPAVYPNHLLWVRNIFFEPRQSAPCANWHFWQYANRGRLEGVNGHVDLNVFCGTSSLFGLLFGAPGA